MGRCLGGLGLLVALEAQAEPLRLSQVDLEEKVNGVLALMSFSVVPDLASSSLSFNDAQSDNPNLTLVQFGGGATMSDDFPLYLEGSAAYSRYDPRFVLSDGQDSRRVPLKWTTVSATGGIGWDFPLNDEWVVRPIANFSLGYISSDVNLARVFINQRFDRDIEFLDDGHMSVGGLGGSLMLDWERVRPDYEVDLELRYSNIELHNIGGDKAIEGSASAEATNLWARWRAPTGFVALQRPVRYVLEHSYSEYLGDQRGALGFDRLFTVGAGLELDSSAYDVFITRTRLVLRYMWGDNVYGSSLGLAMSF
ncbi:autotransporter outer membrane beta-barrel domain-containing protein [Aquipseudomonas ullengensis]|nr:autotransporter outer membrane beta-barrel domain-containing protein [Pseudomonas ullengensis]